MTELLKVLMIAALAAVIVLAALLLSRIPVSTVQTVQAAPLTAAVGSGSTQTGITVSGQGEVKARPDIVRINLGVRNLAPTARGAMDENNATMAAVVAKLKEMGVADKDMQTGSLSLNAQTKSVREGDNTTEVVIGYWANNTLHVTFSDLGKVGAVLDAAIAAGANNVGGISFAVRDDSALKNEALSAAVKDARAKADLVAAGLGLKVTGVESVTVESTGGGFVVRQYAALDWAKAADASVPVEAGELTFSANVRVTFTF